MTPPLADAGPVEIGREALVEAVREVLADRETVRAGRIQVLSMEAVKKRLGHAWPRFAGRVQEAARHAIQRELEPGDRFLSLGDGSYVLLFGKLDGEEARFRALSIVQRVLTRLFGEEAAADPRFRELVGARVAALDLDRLAVERADAGGAWLDDRFDAAEPPAPPAAEPAPDPAEPDYDRYFRWAEGFDTTLLPEELSFRFRPIWDARREALTTYACEIESARTRSGKAIDHRWIYAQEEDARIGHLDAQMLARVGQVLHGISAGRRPILLSLSLHYYTVDARQRRQAYLRQFRHLPEEHGRYLVLTLHGLPEGIPAARAQQLVAELRPHARQVVLRLNATACSDARLRPAGLRLFREAGFDAIGFDAAGLHRDEATLRRLLHGFAAAAAQAELLSFVMGLRSRPMTQEALAAGFSYINSEAIAGPVAEPSFMYRYTAADLAAGRLPEISGG